MIKTVLNKIIKILTLLFKNLKNTKKHIKSKIQGKKWTQASLKKICKMKYKTKKKSLKTNNLFQNKEKILKMKVLVGI